MTDLHPVHSGDPLRIKASTYNAILAATKAHQQSSLGLGRKKKPLAYPSAVFPVKNLTGLDIDRYDILGIDDSLFDPATALSGFQNTPTFNVVVPTSDHASLFVVMQEPMADGMIAKAMLSGVTPVRIDMISEDHKFADVNPSYPHLISGETGSARILTVQSGLGIKWATIRMGDTSAGGGSGITVEDVGEIPINDVTHLTFEHIDVSDEGSGDVKISLPDGGPEMFGLLGWNSYDKKWIKACDGPGMGYPQQLYVDANETISWKDAHINYVSIDGTGYSGVSVISIHHNTIGDASGPILVQSSGSGTHPERTVDLIISHTKNFLSQQNIEVRNAADTGTTTLKFDKYGHFIGT